MEQSGRIITQGAKRGYLTRASLIEMPDGDVVPILGRIPCGNPILAQEDIEEYVRLPENLFGRGDYYLLRAKGDSMINAGINSGDLVLIRQQNTANPGQIIVAIVNDDEGTLQRFYPELEYNRIRLHPENDTFEDMYYPYVTIQGIVIKVIEYLR